MEKHWPKSQIQPQANLNQTSKIIGARLYVRSGTSKLARDLIGHGTHTASTIAGNVVSDVGFYGLAKGNARRGVPSARIATYKVCRENSLKGCPDYAILAAFDDAIADGVDIISISVGRLVAIAIDKDSIAIGAFYAMEKGILTSHSVGNGGPIKQTTTSVAPWLLTVAASSTHRGIINKVSLGDGTVLQKKFPSKDSFFFHSSTINSYILNGTTHPLPYEKEVTKTCSEDNARYNTSFDNSGVLFPAWIVALVKGEIILCDNFIGGIEALSIQALGTTISTTFDDYSFITPQPAIILGTKNEIHILSFKRIWRRGEPGSNFLTLSHLFPHLMSSETVVLNEKRGEISVKYSIVSGTSMSCPHATGGAACVNSFHPDWSASNIKSALMTTAWAMNSTRNPDAEFAYGAGHIDPVKAVDPGLVYVALKDDYVKFLCNIGWNAKRISIISGDNSSCPKSSKGASIDLNYPSMAVHRPPSTVFVINFPRRVTNVGTANSTYKASVISDSKIKISVKPGVLSFTSLHQEKSFVVTVSGSGVPQGSMASGSLVWSDGTHSVRSPIAVYS
ncbi:hypothetical protein NE237_023883 [Protea cynaroides]|uniref:Cucumisin n=1 Tax=Protea cynaroides TaxID=273540 RepID=A0A9Q0HDM6_9MAGN|nr:hypothetical protein NE237_023883 [Protea cynaroides]